MSASKFEIEEAISRQIGVEQGLRSTRMNWNLTFQGFMVAAFALVAAEELTPARFALELIICGAGFAVALATWFGIRAAQMQSNLLKTHWRKHVPADSPYPVPFSLEGGSKLGRLPTAMICGTTMVMWLALTAIVVFAPATF